MAALAYLLLPLTGMVAYFLSRRPRTRFHGAQAVALGFLWPVALYASSFVAPLVTQITAVLGALVWIGLMISTALGKDLRLPYLGDLCAETTGLEERA